MKRTFFTLRELAFRLKLYFLGVRFYEIQETEPSPVVHSAQYHVGETVRIDFTFHRKICNDFVLRRGSLVGETYSSYIVKAVFSSDEDLSAYKSIAPYLNVLNNKAFFFNGYYNSFGIEESRTLELIMDIYIDFIKETFRIHEAPSWV